jgi:hypothetical protein
MVLVATAHCRWLQLSAYGDETWLVNLQLPPRTILKAVKLSTRWARVAMW